MQGFIPHTAKNLSSRFHTINKTKVEEVYTGGGKGTGGQSLKGDTPVLPIVQWSHVIPCVSLVEGGKIWPPWKEAR